MGSLKTMLAALVLATAACTATPVDSEDFRAGAAASEDGCVGACDHVYADGGWKVVLGHRHGPGCGHERVNGRWVRKTIAPEDGEIVDPPKD